MRVPERLRRSLKQEKGIAKDIAGRRVAGSGSQLSDKGDVQNSSFLVEAKTTNGAGFRLTPELWVKIAREAWGKGKEPAMVIEINGLKLAVVSYEMFQALAVLGLSKEK